jgi:hypothetical protein
MQEYRLKAKIATIKPEGGINSPIALRTLIRTSYFLRAAYFAAPRGSQKITHLDLSM